MKVSLNNVDYIIFLQKSETIFVSNVISINKSKKYLELEAGVNCTSYYGKK